jgi:hypothetical protein
MRKENTMTVNQRFSVDENKKIIDRANPANSRKYYPITPILMSAMMSASAGAYFANFLGICLITS